MLKPYSKSTSPDPKDCEPGTPAPMLKPRSLNVRLSLVFFFFFLLVSVLGLFSIERLSEFNSSTAGIRDLWLPNTRYIGDLANFTSDFRAAEGRDLLSSTSAEAAASAKDMEVLDQEISQAQSGYEGLRHRAVEADLYATFRTQWTAYRKIVDQVLELAAAGRSVEAVTLYRTDSQAAYNAASDTLDRITDLNVRSAAQASDRADLAYQDARRLIMLAMLIAAALVIAALIYVRRSISDPLLDLAAAMHRLAGRKTDIAIHGTDRTDEIGEMSRAVVVFRNNAIELILNQTALSQQAAMLEEKLAHEQRLTRLQHDFVSMASHEFRTPLTVIDAQAQRLAKTSERASAQEIAGRAGQIRRAVLRMTTLIDYLLNSSHLMEHGPELYFHPAEIDLRTILHEVCHLHREVAPRANLVEETGAQPLTMRGDAKLLFQVFSNLVANAIKYSPDGSLVRVTAGIDGENVEAAVEDRGIGIPEGDLAQVFDRFNRGSNVSGVVGTGVGLYLVKMVVDLHGGEVVVTSKPGEGSRFTVRLPRNGAAKKDEDAAVSLQPASAGADAGAVHIPAK
jgi:two-component system, OmpR family, sensor kinase